MAVTLDSFSNQLEIIQRERFSGLLIVSAPGVQQWEIFFHIGDIVWARGGEHWRRWRRMLYQLGVCNPIVEVEEIGSNDYKLLVGWVQSGKLVVEQASALIGSTINEVLFDIFQQESLTKERGGQLTFNSECRKILPKCLKLVGTKLATTQAKSSWQQWCDEGLLYVSPNWVPVVCSPVREELSQVQLELLQLVDGNRSLRDLAVLSGQSLITIASQLDVWFYKGLIDMSKLPDLQPDKLFLPLSQDISRLGKNLLSQEDGQRYRSVELPTAERHQLNGQTREQVLLPKKPYRSFKWLLLLVLSVFFGSGYLLFRSQNGSLQESAIALTNMIEWSSLIPSAKNSETVELKVLGDTFSGYSLLQDAKFQQELLAYGIDVKYQHEFNQQRRAALLSEGQGDLAVTTIDQFLLWQPKARIVGLIDRSSGGDAIVLNTKQYPQLKSLASLNQVQESAQHQGKLLTITYAGSTPSEYLALLAQTKFGGLDTANFQVRKVEDASIAWELLQKENIAIAVLWEPYVSQARSRGYINPAIIDIASS